jgi:hypothetical protein
MRKLMFVIVLLVVGIAGLGYYRGWFALSTNNTDQMPSATITVNKEKFNEDRQRTRDEVQGVGQKAKKEVGELTGKAKEPQRQP